MSLVSTTVGLISQQSGIVKNSHLDLNDDTFAKILENNMNNTINNQQNSIQTGIDIGDFDHMNTVFTSNIDVNSNNSAQFNFDKDMTTSEILTFFPSIFDSKPDIMSTETNGVFDLERKLAANTYCKYAKNLVTDLSDFVTDALKAKS